jgi:hypothetical protein
MAVKHMSAVAVVLLLTVLALGDDKPKAKTPPPETPKKRWLADPLAPAGVKKLVEDLPSLKNQYLKSLDDKVTAVKAKRTEITKEQHGSSEVVSGGAPFGAISRNDHSGEVEQQKRIRECDQEVLRIYREKKAAIADDLWLPPSMNLEAQAESIAKLNDVQILQIVDKDNALITTAGSVVWLSGVDTSKMTENAPFTLAQWVEVEGTKQYTNKLGAQNVVLHIEAVDIKKFLVQSDGKGDGEVGHPDPAPDPSK